MENKIKTFEDACASLGVSTTLPDVTALPEKHRKAIEAHYQLVIIAEALNEGWRPDWSNWNEWKYYPWFEIKATKKNPSGVGFSDCDYVGDYAGSVVGSRLCFKSRELAKYAGKQFEQLYKDYFLLND